MEAKRCHIHGLVLGTDGRCVICRRDQSEIGDATAPPVGTAQYVAILGAALVSAGLGLVIYKLAIEEDDLPAPLPDVVQVAEETDAEPVTVQAARPPPPRPPPVPLAAESEPESPLAADAEAKARLEGAMRRVQVTMYATSWCELCQRAQGFFGSKGISLRVLDIEKSETDKILLRSINPAQSVPTFDVEGQVLVGYSERALEEAVLRAAEKKIASR